MQAALALAIDPAGARRRRKGGGPWILLVSSAAHLLVLGGLIVGMRVDPRMVDPPALSVELQRSASPPKAVATQKPATAPSRLAPVRPSPAASGFERAPTLTVPAAPTQAVAPPGFTARALTGGGDALRQAARAGIGCRDADLLALTRAERAVCDEKLGEKYKTGPAMYAVIDPDKKAAFDGACKRDDDWCLYRTGEGPYPGLFALGRKKKNVDW